MIFCVMLVSLANLVILANPLEFLVILMNLMNTMIEIMNDKYMNLNLEAPPLYLRVDDAVG